MNIRKLLRTYVRTYARGFIERLYHLYHPYGLCKTLLAYYLQRYKIFSRFPNISTNICVLQLIFCWIFKLHQKSRP